MSGLAGDLGSCVLGRNCLELVICGIFVQVSKHKGNEVRNRKRTAKWFLKKFEILPFTIYVESARSAANVK